MAIKQIEIKGFTKDEAIANSELPYTIFKDATQAWKNAGLPMGKDLNAFMDEHLKKATKCAPGLGCIITIKSGTADSRERPYKINDVVNEKGRRVYKTCIELFDKATGESLGTIFDTKAVAKDYGRSLYTEKGYRGDIIARYGKQVVDGEVGAFTMEYTPSKSASEGKWLCFGIENN